MPSAVLDLDLEVRGDPSSRSLDGGRWGGTSKKFFSALQASVWFKNRGGGRGAPQAPSLDLPLFSHCVSSVLFIKSFVIIIID